MPKSKTPPVEEPENDSTDDLIIDSSGGPLADIDGPAPDELEDEQETRKFINRDKTIINFDISLLDFVGQRPSRRSKISSRRKIQQIGNFSHVNTGVTIHLVGKETFFVTGAHKLTPIFIEQG